MAGELLLVLYTVVSWTLVLYNVNFYYLLFHSLMPSAPARRGPLRRFPVVTIQLPIYNERYVVRRLVKSVCSLKYPKERLEIQVLDDSDDETANIARSVVEQFRRLGHRIEYLRRPERSGYKAGALQYGLTRAEGEFIAIFDADFIPTPEFLLKAIPQFRDRSLGLVQAKWGHTNPGYSALTRAQAISLDVHFMVEQRGRANAGLFLNFNGTAGVWRRDCLISSGGWRNLLAEDLDISYRAQMVGWRCRFLDNLVCPAELPVQMNACKRQQARWARGSMQVFLKLGAALLTAPMPFKVRFQAFMHLTRHVVHPLLIIQLLLTPILLSFGYDLAPVGALLSVLVFGPAIYLFVLKRIYGLGWWSKIPDYFYVLLFGTGVSVNNSVAWLKGLSSSIGQFLRTPKFGIVNREESWRNKKYVLPLSEAYTVVGEISLGIYGSITIFLSVLSANFFLLPGLLVVSAGFFYVGFTNVLHSLNPPDGSLDQKDRPRIWLEQTVTR